jgi:hypothetical protein
MLYYFRFYSYGENLFWPCLHEGNPTFVRLKKRPSRAREEGISVGSMKFGRSLSLFAALILDSTTTSKSYIHPLFQTSPCKQYQIVQITYCSMYTKFASCRVVHSLYLKLSSIYNSNQ